MNYHKFFKDYVEKVRFEKRYRNFVPIIRKNNEFPYAYHPETNKQVVLWCINDYLGMSSNHIVVDACKDSINKYGVGSGGTRNIGGNNQSLLNLEKTVAQFHNKEGALVFTSGYVANQGTLSNLAKIIPDLIFFSDELNHSSIIEGIKSSKLDKQIYKHNDIYDLEQELRSVDPRRPKIIVFESVYSMNGIISPVREICNLAKKYNAMTYIDEVHSVGLYGRGGTGIANMLNCDDKIDIIQGTLSKAYGVIGGYIAGPADIIDAIRLSSNSFIFTTSLPPCLADSATASINYLSTSNIERENIMSNVKKVKTELTKAGIKFIKNDSHIIAVGIGDPELSEKISKKLYDEYDIYIQHINFPTVPKGTERLRITPTSGHNDDMISHLADSLSKIFKELSITQIELSA